MKGRLLGVVFERFFGSFICLPDNNNNKTFYLQENQFLEKSLASHELVVERRVGSSDEWIVGTTIIAPLPNQRRKRSGSRDTDGKNESCGCQQTSAAVKQTAFLFRRLTFVNDTKDPESPSQRLSKQQRQVP
uniref:Uncharacterized protein n=1 Tax=Grammatophora oceanica TaxID=210454 RepID=A0A7S1VDN9_9STRA|mmetsp:Transcript_43680/g.64852  ORF Transcript_43680/g.64852 Transcript_43680/m.64852 type:complete len:132 (+) Transcript_43680:729-1124(+)